MPTILRRYTDVLSVLDIIVHRRLSLLSPKTWFDRNDAYGLEMYRQRKGKGSVYALCMALHDETAHHWQLFAGSNHGVCIEFNEWGFRKWIDNCNMNVLHGPVRYVEPQAIEKFAELKTNEIPFLKNKVYEKEVEYRLVAWLPQENASDAFLMPMPVELIRKIVFGPMMPRSLAETLMGVIQNAPGAELIRFTRSRIGDNEVWRQNLLDASNR